MIRQLKMHYAVLIEIGAQVVQIAAMILFAWMSPTVWALMAGMLLGAGCKAAASHLLIPGPRMRLAWDREIAGRLWHFGKWLMGSSLFSFVALNADRFILGGLLDATLFGIYVIAQIWVGAGTMVITRLSSQVGFSAVSEVLRTRPHAAPKVYRKFQSGIDALCLAAFAVLLLGGQLLIDLLYVETYAEAGRYLTLLSLSFLSLRFYTHSELIMSLGKTREMMWISGIRAVSICIALPVAWRLGGMETALLVIALNPLVTSFYALSILRPLLGQRQIRFDQFWVIMTLAIALGIVTLT